MKLIIDIPEELYKHIKNDNVYYLEDGEDLYTIIKNGTPYEEHEDNSKLHYAIGYNEGYTGGYKQAVIELKHGLERRLRGDV